MATLTKKDERKALAGALAIAQHIAKFPVSQLWLDFDSEADVLYISLQRPQKANNTVEIDDGGILLHYQGKKLVGITVLDASTR